MPHKWSVMSCSKFKACHEIDILLSEAIKIASSYENEIGELGWFTILEFLAKYNDSIQEKVEKQL
jgi:hypothetical protein